MKVFDAIVIGGGPAGMMAAIRAGERKKSVLLIERNRSLGKKLLLSGKGRCNLTNIGSLDKFLEKFSKTGVFLRNTFVQFFNEDLMEFFKNLRVKLKIERGGRVFPESGEASEVLSALINYLKEKEVKIVYGERVLKINLDKRGIKEVFTKKKRIRARSVILATGGVSYPQTGSTGDGFYLASLFGHTIIKPRPALVPLEIENNFIKEWQGISLENVRCQVLKDAKKISERFGEMIFTHFGVSGPIILDLSSEISDALFQSKNVEISINFKPALNLEKLNNRLLREFNYFSNKKLKNIFRSLLPKRLVRNFLIYTKVPEDIRANRVTREMRKKLVDALLDFRLKVKGVRPIEEAIVTSGGVSTDQINPKTMESKIVKGIYFCGEIIDVDAKSGGYNLQAAFSTGWVAGDNA